MKLYDSGVSLQKQSSLCIRAQPMRATLTLTAAVHLGSCSRLAARSRSSAPCSRLWRTTELRARGRGGSGWQGLIQAKHGGKKMGRGGVFFFFFFLFGGFNVLPKKKLTSASMQSESGIVPDFEVGEEFQEEPKTYYELKSQPLKNRSVVRLKTVISHAAAVLVFRC